MKIKVLSTCDDITNPGYLKLKASLDKFGYDHECIVHPFSFGGQMPVLYEWCKNYKGDCTHILYSDAFDTIALAPMYDDLEKIIFSNYYVSEVMFLGSAEKGCYPNSDLAMLYPRTRVDWRYVNGGNWLCEIKYFIKLYEENQPNGKNDQLWLSEMFLAHQDAMKLDTSCLIFQSIAFEGENDFSITRNKRLSNRMTATLPIFIHGNGKTDMAWIYDFAT